MPSSQYLYVSFFSKGSGFGHAMRAFACARHCLALGHAMDIVFESSEGADQDVSTRPEYKALVEMHAELLRSPKLRLISKASKAQQGYDAVFVDCRQMSYERFCVYNKLGFCIGLDLGGAARQCMPYLIDTLPNFLSKPNVYDPAGFVDASMPERSAPPHECTRVLLYAPHVAAQEYVRILETCVEHNMQCTLVGAVGQGGILPQELEDFEKDVRFAPFTCNFAHTLCEYDLVITHFGLSAFEATHARVPVLLVNPSAYHAALSKKAGFTHCYRSYKRAATQLTRFATKAHVFTSFAARFTAGQRRSGVSVYDRLLTSAEKIRSWYAERSPINPFDRAARRMPRALLREEDKSVFLCKQTKLIFQVPFADPVSYNDAYFFSDYKAQYGKTYLEDFDAIAQKMDERLNIVQRIGRGRWVGNAPRLLDLGCAYGVMLKRALSRRFLCCGVDIYKDACDYVRNTLFIPSLCASVFKADFGAVHAQFAQEHTAYFQSPQGVPLRYDVVSCWYVLEHTPHFESVLQTVSRLLVPGGIFALAVPNGSGISARRYPRRFLQANPIDHFSIFSPKPLIAFLKKRGFALRLLRVTGHHPSCVLPHALQWSLLFAPVRRAVHGLSKLLRLGDTFELYLEKEREV